MERTGPSIALRGNAYALLSAVTWGSGFPVTELLLARWDPLPLACARLLLGSAIMLVAVAALRAAPRPAAIPWRDVGLIGSLGSAGSVACLILGQARSDPVTSAIIVTSQPIVALLMGLALDGDRLRATLVAGVILAVAGAVIASPATDGVAAFRGGEPLVLASMVLWTWYARAARARLAGMHDILVGGLTMGTGALVLGVLALMAASAAPARWDVGPASLPWLLWMGAVSVGLSTPLWLAGARLLGVTLASLHLNLVPFYVMLMGLALGGTVSLRQVAGACLVVAGAIVAQIRRR